MKMKPSGFSAVHLMGAVAALAAVTASGLPKYEDHLLKTQLSEAYNLAEATRSRVDEFYSGTGRLPATDADSDMVGLQDLARPEFVREIRVDPRSKLGEIAIEVHFHHSALAVDVAQGSFLYLAGSRTPAPASTVEWRCGSSGIDPGYLPAPCLH